METMKENEIVLYQPNETVRLEVRVENETVWLSQAQMAALFGTGRQAITKHIKNIYEGGELQKEATCSILELVRLEGKRNVSRWIEFYNLDVIISVGYRVNTLSGIHFRQWATSVLKEHLLKGYSINARLTQMEERIALDFDILECRGVDVEATIFVERITPALLVLQSDCLIQTGRKSELRTTRTRVHDRFLIVDNQVYHLGASLKDLGRKLFAFSKMGLDKAVIMGQVM